MLEKNGKIYKYTQYDNTFLFNRGLMDIQIEGWNPEIKMNYDDIICIRTSFLQQDNIPDLPLALKELEIQYSNLSTVPVFPKGIRKVRLINNKIEITEKLLADVRANYPKTFIQIENLDMSMMRGKSITMEEILIKEQLRVARERIIEIDTDTRPVFRINLGNNKNVLDTTQTVHIPSINNGVNNAIFIIKEKSAKCPVVKNPLDALFAVEKQGFWSCIQQRLMNWIKGRVRLYSQIQSWMDDSSIHSLHGLTFANLFQMVMNIAEVHPQKFLLKERIQTELTDAIGHCFTGRINMLVNSLVGFIEEIQIGITVRETIQIKIQDLVQKLMKEKISVSQAKEEMTMIFENVGVKDGITDDFKQANLLALDDFLD